MPNMKSHRGLNHHLMLQKFLCQLVKVFNPQVEIYTCSGYFFSGVLVNIIENRIWHLKNLTMFMENSRKFINNMDEIMINIDNIETIYISPRTSPPHCDEDNIFRSRKVERSFTKPSILLKSNIPNRQSEQEEPWTDHFHKNFDFKNRTPTSSYKKYNSQSYRRYNGPPKLVEEKEFSQFRESKEDEGILEDIHSATMGFDNIKRKSDQFNCPTKYDPVRFYDCLSTKSGFGRTSCSPFITRTPTREWTGSTLRDFTKNSYYSTL